MYSLLFLNLFRVFLKVAICTEILCVSWVLQEIISNFIVFLIWQIGYYKEKSLSIINFVSFE